MEITLQSNEYRRHDAKASRNLTWNLVMGGAGLSLLTTMAVLAKGPVKEDRPQRIPANYVSLFSPRSEGLPASSPVVFQAESARTYRVVPTPKPPVLASAKAAPAPLAMPVRRSASPDGDFSACDASCRQPMSRRDATHAAPAVSTSEMSLDNQGFDDTTRRPGPLAMAASAFGKVAGAPLTVLAFGRDAIGRVAGVTE
ncbi:hypothetical protein C8J35_11239 [Rhizobium sp. PP-F2F-G38]|nr:hypothetical protein C8J35_11239 [Rhizobium sp. PP-F2F-G38]TCP78011.1 hypothetical protein C8J31_12139 [Rhizobium sp. PP-CC-2G-626]